LKQNNIEYFELGGIKPNPRIELVYEGIKICRDRKIEFLLAVGGGSVIDTAKAIAMGAYYDGDVWDFYLAKAEATRALPIGTVLTIPAAGSEASNGSVITKLDGQFKRHCDNDLTRPKFAIMNPELTFSLTAYQTACGVSDIMAHIMERYFTKVPNVELTDRLCEGTLKTVIQNAPVIMREPDNYAARAEVMWAGTLAHNDLLSTGRIGDFASHMVEHELSAINDIPHGAGLAILLPAWMKYAYKTELKRFVQFAVRVWNVEQSFEDPEKTAREGIEKLKAFYISLGLPTSLSEVGITNKHFQTIADKCRKFDAANCTVGNFIKLTKQDIINILGIAK
jgi:alcohol dehydrogenase YqhD (iron-dependent ADH family)